MRPEGRVLPNRGAGTTREEEREVTRRRPCCALPGPLVVMLRSDPEMQARERAAARTCRTATVELSSDRMRRWVFSDSSGARGSWGSWDGGSARLLTLACFEPFSHKGRALTDHGDFTETVASRPLSARRFDRAWELFSLWLTLPACKVWTRSRNGKTVSR